MHSQASREVSVIVTRCYFVPANKPLPFHTILPPSIVIALHSSRTYASVHALNADRPPPDNQGTLAELCLHDSMAPLPSRNEHLPDYILTGRIVSLPDNETVLPHYVSQGLMALPPSRQNPSSRDLADAFGLATSRRAASSSSGLRDGVGLQLTQNRRDLITRFP